MMLKLPTYQFMHDYMLEGDKVEAWLLDILELQEARDRALQKFSRHQEIVKRWFYKRAKIKSFWVTDLILLWDKAHEKKGQHSKFDPLWMGPYQIANILGDSTLRLKYLSGNDLSLPVNGRHLKHYFMAVPLPGILG